MAELALSLSQQPYRIDSFIAAPLLAAGHGSRLML
jgi:hypothetical protein